MSVALRGLIEEFGLQIEYTMGTRKMQFLTAWNG